MGEVLVSFVVLLMIFLAVAWRDRRSHPRHLVVAATTALAHQVEEIAEADRICLCSYCPMFDGQRCLLSTSGERLVSWEACEIYRKSLTAVD